MVLVLVYWRGGVTLVAHSLSFLYYVRLQLQNPDHHLDWAVHTRELISNLFCFYKLKINYGSIKVG